MKYETLDSICFLENFIIVRKSFEMGRENEKKKIKTCKEKRIKKTFLER